MTSKLNTTLENEIKKIAGNVVRVITQAEYINEMKANRTIKTTRKNVYYDDNKCNVSLSIQFDGSCLIALVDLGTRGTKADRLWLHTEIEKINS